MFKERKHPMKTGRNMIMLTMLLLVFIFLLSGCEEAVSYYSEAAVLYGRGEYSEAEPFFISAIESGDDAVEVHIGHAYNLLKLERYSNAIDEFLQVLDTVTDDETLIAVRKAMLEAYLKDDNPAGAARVCDEIAELPVSKEEAASFLLEAAQIRADIYSVREDKELYRQSLLKLIELKDYAGEEYLRLYSIL